MTPDFKKQMMVLSYSELFDFHVEVKRRLSKDPLGLAERANLQRLEPELEELLKTKEK